MLCCNCPINDPLAVTYCSAHHCVAWSLGSAEMIGKSYRGAASLIYVLGLILCSGSFVHGLNNYGFAASAVAVSSTRLFLPVGGTILLAVAVVYVARQQRRRLEHRPGTADA